MIEVDALSARAGAFLLRDISFSLPRGAWGIVLGSAGAGKTTLLETIAGVRPAAAGRVALRGADVTHLPPERRGVGIVYQHAFLFPHLSVEENVRYGAADAHQAVELARRLGPDVVLMDVSMPVLDGFEATREIRATSDDTHVLMLTGSNSRADVDRSREAGASGYVTKDRIASELVAAIVEVTHRRLP